MQKVKTMKLILLICCFLHKSPLSVCFNDAYTNVNRVTKAFDGSYENDHSKPEYINVSPLYDSDVTFIAPTTVVKLSKKRGIVVQDCDVYIGRQVQRGGWNLPKSKWHNPFSAKDSSVESITEAVNKFESYMRNSPNLMNSIEELRGKRLGCWCKTTPDAPCHGDVLVKILDELDSKK